MTNEYQEILNELEEAKLGQNSYGGDIAEIYLHRLVELDASDFEGKPENYVSGYFVGKVKKLVSLPEEEQYNLRREAAKKLIRLCCDFEKANNIKATVQEVDDLEGSSGFCRQASDCFSYIDELAKYTRWHIKVKIDNRQKMLNDFNEVFKDIMSKYPDINFNEIDWSDMAFGFLIGKGYDPMEACDYNLLCACNACEETIDD